MAIAAGRLHVLALKTDGTVWAWGQNQRGELGNGTTSPSGTPVQVQNLTGVIAIAAGSQFSLALKSDGTVWSWGSGSFGGLGIPYDGQNRKVPGPVSLQAGVVAIAAGMHHALALRSDGSVWAWGENLTSQLGVEPRVVGDGILPFEFVPVQVPQVDSATAIAAGQFHSAALRADGTLLTWGYNGTGQLGLGDFRPTAPPTAVPGLGPVRAVAGGLSATYALLEDGQFFAWGLKLRGALGNGEDGTQTTPTLIPDLTGVTALVATAAHTLALLSDGTVWAWGSPWTNRPQETAPPLRLSPMQLDGLPAAKAISARGSHALALATDGSVWAWGDNSYGEVTGNPFAYGAQYLEAPVAVAGLPADVTAIAACGRYNLALQSTGEVWAWGDASALVYGELTFPNKPTPLKGLPPAVQIACGDAQNFALESDGTAWVWGYNYAGMLGLGTTGDSLPPTRLSLTELAAPAGGRSHSLALRRDGTVWAWGSNDAGQLGDGTHIDRSLPVAVPGLAGVASLAAGSDRSYAVMQDGTVRAWGRQGAGQLADGSNESAPSPVRVPDPAPPDLAVSLAFPPGETPALAVNVANQGGLILTGTTTLTVTLPQPLRFVSAEAPGWFCTSDASVVIGSTSQPFGGFITARVLLKAALDANATEPLEVIAEVSNPADTNADNNTARLALAFGASPAASSAATMAACSASPSTNSQAR